MHCLSPYFAEKCLERITFNGEAIEKAIPKLALLMNTEGRILVADAIKELFPYSRNGSAITQLNHLIKKINDAAIEQKIPITIKNSFSKKIFLRVLGSGVRGHLQKKTISPLRMRNLCHRSPPQKSHQNSHQRPNQ